MSKQTDVHYGRQGGRLVPTEDGRSHLEHLDELRQQRWAARSVKPTSSRSKMANSTCSKKHDAVRPTRFGRMGPRCRQIQAV